MTKHDWTEIAYKNGFDDGVKAGVRHGTWHNNGNNWVCSYCRNTEQFPFPYCPWCGTKNANPEVKNHDYGY